MEELPLCTQPLHHVHTLPAEEAHVAAPDVGGELFSERALRKGEEEMHQSILWTSHAG